jgi:hypothetical protein
MARLAQQEMGELGIEAAAFATPRLRGDCIRQVRTGLVHPTGFEPVASAFGGLRNTELTRFFVARSCFRPVNRAGTDVRC